METKHTKGKWILINKTPNTRIIGTKEITGEIARVYSENEISKNEMVANAKLIASAPEMFEMLNLVLKENHCTPDLDKQIEQLLTKITE